MEPNLTESEYIVQENDSLWAIATSYGMTTLELAKLNNISTNSPISKGQSLKVVSYVYEVQRDETLKDISRKVGLTPKRIAGLNGLGDPDTATLYQGQFLKIG